MSAIVYAAAMYIFIEPNHLFSNCGNVCETKKNTLNFNQLLRTTFSLSLSISKYDGYDNDVFFFL